jgi:hypothetical protein
VRIALDYDKTYTTDPWLWDAFISHAQHRGHEVRIVTMRRPDDEAILDPPVPVIYSSRAAKNTVYNADIWIDDAPHWIYQASM